MSRDDLAALFVNELARIAPDASLGSLGPDDDLRDELDLDSMDVLTLAGRLEGALHIRIPERDYREFRTIRASIDYLERSVGTGPAASP